MRSLLQNIQAAVLKYGVSEKLLKVRIFSVWNYQSVITQELYCIALASLSEKLWKIDEGHFCKNLSKGFGKFFLENFWKVMGEFSRNYRQIIGKKVHESSLLKFRGSCFKTLP